MQHGTNKNWVELRDKFGLSESLVDTIISDFAAIDVTKPERERSATEECLAAAPYDLYALSNHLQERYRLDHRSAGRLAHFFGHKAKVQIDIKRQLSLGIVKGVWRFTPVAAYRHCDHASLDNREFDLRKGIRFNGQHIYPGREPGCMCTVQPVIPGFDDEPVGLVSRVLRWLRRPQ